MKFRQNKKRIDPRYFLNEIEIHDPTEFEAAAALAAQYSAEEEKKRLETGSHARQQAINRQTRAKLEKSLRKDPYTPGAAAGPWAAGEAPYDPESPFGQVPGEDPDPLGDMWAQGERPTGSEEHPIGAPYVAGGEDKQASEFERSKPRGDTPEAEKRREMDMQRSIAHAAKGMPSCQGTPEHCQKQLSAIGKLTDEIELGMKAVGAEKPEDIPNAFALEVALAVFGLGALKLTKPIFGMLANKYGFNMASKIADFVNMPGVPSWKRAFAGPTSVPGAVENLTDAPGALKGGGKRAQEPSVSPRWSKKYREKMQQAMRENNQYQLTALQLKYIIDEVLRSI